MLTIKRNCSYQIITHAVHADGKPLVALLMPDADNCEYCLDQDQLQVSLDASPQAIIVYNQQPEALALVAKLSVPATQIFIEVRQDTKGVLGLHALHKQNNEAQTLELIYQ